MFNVGGGEMIMLGVLALLVFGPEGLPNIVKTVMRTVRQLRNAARDFQNEVKVALDEESNRQDIAKRRRKPLPPEAANRAPLEQVDAPPLPPEDDSELGETEESSVEPEVTSESAAPIVEAEDSEDNGGLEETSEPTDVESDSSDELPEESVSANLDPATYFEASAEAEPNDESSPAPESEVAENTSPESEDEEDDDDDGPGIPMGSSKTKESA